MFSGFMKIMFCYAGKACALALVICLAVFTGCTTLSIEKIPPQEGIYPSRLLPDAPLVLAIPGLRIPALSITQDQHFGFLVEMLAAEGIPCRIITYDTKEHPLSKGAALFSSDLAIAWTRVVPSVVREIEFENERREAFGFPPVRTLVFFGYSQGSVIMEQLARRIFYSFRNRCEEMKRLLGNEWPALSNDPEFNYFVNALEDFIVIKNIKVQREQEFQRDPDLRSFYQRAENKMSRQFEEFFQYLLDPSIKYPDVRKFEGPLSPKYPKRYKEARQCALMLESRRPGYKKKIREFFIDYAEYRELIDMKPYFFSSSGSYFGSPRANESYKLFKWFPPLRLFAGAELNQIKQTQLGSLHHLENIEELAQLNRDHRYPIDPDNTLFIVGANGDKGDGLVDQASAHLSDHAFFLAEVERAGKSAEWKLECLERERLPDLFVAPLPVMHFPEKVLWGLGGKKYGSAYMEKGNPVFPYLLHFIRNDWNAIYNELLNCDIGLRQFMLQVACPAVGQLCYKVRRVGQSRHVHIDGRYYNAGSNTMVWTGHFKGTGQEMNLCQTESIKGVVDLSLTLSGGQKLPVGCEVYPGCISFVMLKTPEDVSEPSR